MQIQRRVSMTKKNVIVAQSGGPTVAINASLAGVVDAAIQSEQYETIYGSIYGILGILEDRLMNLSEKVSTVPNFIETLKFSPAMYLGSCRYKLPDYEDDDATYAFILINSKNTISELFSILAVTTLWILY